MYSVPQKKAPLKEKPYKNKKYLQWLHNNNLCCHVCSSHNIEIHHLESGAKGRPDNKCVILCPEHHRGKFSPHGAEAKEFNKMYLDDLYMVSEELFNEFKGEECE